MDATANAAVPQGRYGTRALMRQRSERRMTREDLETGTPVAFVTAGMESPVRREGTGKKHRNILAQVGMNRNERHPCGQGGREGQKRKLSSSAIRCAATSHFAFGKKQHALSHNNSINDQNGCTRSTHLWRRACLAFSTRLSVKARWGKGTPPAPATIQQAARRAVSVRRRRSLMDIDSNARGSLPPQKNDI